MSRILMLEKAGKKLIVLHPFEEGGAYRFAHVGRSVCMSESLNLVKLITKECFASEALSLEGIYP